MTNYCKECKTFLEPEFDEWNKREKFLGEIIYGFGIKECRCCETKNIFVERGHELYPKDERVFEDE